MSAPFANIDPEVWEVLGDIAKDGRSRLFRADPQKALSSVVGARQSFSDHAVSLTRAERHLLSAHEEEILLIIHVVGERLIREDAFWIDRMNDAVTINRRITPLTSVDLGKRFQRVERAAPHRGQWNQAAGLLREVDALGWEPRSAEPYLAGVASIAVRIANTNCARIHLAHDLIKRNEIDSALTMLEGALATKRSAKDGSLVLETIAVANIERGRIDLAHQSLSRRDDVGVFSAVSSGLLVVDLLLPGGPQASAHGRWRPGRNGRP